MAESFSSSPFELWPLPDTVRSKNSERITLLISKHLYRAQTKETLSIDASEYGIWIEEDAFSIADAEFKSKSLTPNEAISTYAKAASTLLTKGNLTDIVKKHLAPEPAEKTFDISGGDRSFVDEVSSKGLLEPLLVPGNGFQKVVLSNHSFHPEAAVLAAQGLANAKDTLIHVDLSDIIAGQVEERALSSLEIICNGLKECELKSLDLSDNALGEKGVRACAVALQTQTKLESLSFCNDGISVDAAEAIRELLPAVDHLKELHFHNNCSCDEGAQAVAEVVSKTKVLESFRFSSTRVGPEGGMSLVKALAKGVSLKKLDLKDNMFDEEVGEAMAEMLGNQPQLTNLNLTYTGLGDGGVIAIASALETSAPDLKVLELGGNDATEESADALAKLVASKSLVKLSLNENELGDKGVEAIAESLSPSSETLEVLDLSCAEITVEGGLAVANAVKNFKKLKLLNLNENNIPEADVALLKAVLNSGTVGESALFLDEVAVKYSDDDEEVTELDSKISHITI